MREQACVVPRHQRMGKERDRRRWQQRTTTGKQPSDSITYRVRKGDLKHRVAARRLVISRCDALEP